MCVSDHSCVSLSDQSVCELRVSECLVSGLSATTATVGSVNHATMYRKVSVCEWVYSIIYDR